MAKKTGSGYYLPKPITKRELKNSERYQFSPRDMSADAAPPARLCCERCFKGIARGEECTKSDDPEHRCDYCVGGRRGWCAHIPIQYNGRCARLLALRATYVANRTRVGNVPVNTMRADAALLASALRLARAQKEATRSLAAFNRAKKNAGTPAKKKTPHTSTDFMSLILEQHVAQTALIGGLVKEARRSTHAHRKTARALGRAHPPAADDESDTESEDSDGPGSDPGDEDGE